MHAALAKVFLTTGGISNLADRSRKYHRIIRMFSSLSKCLQQHVEEPAAFKHILTVKAEQRNGNRTDIIIQE